MSVVRKIQGTEIQGLEKNKLNRLMLLVCESLAYISVVFFESMQGLKILFGQKIILKCDNCLLRAKRLDI